VMAARYHGAEVVIKAPIMAQDRAQAKILLAAAEELRIFRRLHHPNIVGFYGACIDPASSEIILVLEYIHGRELHCAIKGTPSKTHEVVDRCILADNVCSALAYLHAQTPVIIHGDIKGSNVLVEQLGDRRNAKLLDFGLSRLVTRRTRDLGGTLRWMAPEIIRKDINAKAPSTDVFSFGRLVYLIMTGRQPLAGTTQDDIMRAAGSNTGLELDWPEEMPLLQEAKVLCGTCLTLDSFARPTIVAAQEALRRWGSSAALPGNFQMALNEAFPQQACCSASSELALQSALARARSRSEPPSTSGSSSVLQQLHRQRQRQRQGLELAVPLLAPQWEATPDSSKLASLALALTGWNLPLSESACCSKHVLVQDVRRLTLILQGQACRDIVAVDDSQCQSCKLLGCGQVDGVNTCELCAGSLDAAPAAEALAERRSKQIMAMERLSGTLDGEATAAVTARVTARL